MLEVYVGFHIIRDYTNNCTQFDQTRYILKTIWKLCRNPTLRQVWGWDSHSPKVGTWSPPGLPQLQSSIAEVKTPCLEVFFVLLESPWSVDVENGLTWAIRTLAAQVMVERKVGNQIDNLTPDHKKSGIDPIPVCASGVQHTVEKLSRRDTSLLQTSSQSEVWAGSYELPKSWESKPRQFRDSSLGVPGIKAIWMWVQRSNAENTIWGKVMASLESGPWWVKWVKWVRVAHGLSQHQECFQRWTNQLVIGLMQDRVTK